MNTISTKPLSGFMELLPQEQRVFNEMMETIRRIYEQSGFIPMDQPVLDRKEVLLAKAGGETEKQIYTLEKGDAELALRFDLTVPLARYVANNYGDLVFPFRRYAIGKVYRGERAQAGRFREFYQCDIDIIGNETLAIGYDAEMPIMTARIFAEFDDQYSIGDVTIRINNRKLYEGLFNSLNLQDKREQIMQLIDKREKISPEEFKTEMSTFEITSSQEETIKAFLSASLDDINTLGIDNEQFNEGVSELLEVMSICQNSGIDPTRFVFDPTIARGLDYYTGTVFETKLDDYPEIGSVCSGGRYENLASSYTNRALPGVGTSIGLSRLFDQLVKKEVITIGEERTSSQVLILPIDGQSLTALEIQQSLLMNEIACEINWSTGKLDKRLSYGDKMAIPYTIIIGEDEVAQQLFAFKNMRTGEDQKLSLEQIIAAVQHKEDE